MQFSILALASLAITALAAPTAEVVAPAATIDNEVIGEVVEHLKRSENYAAPHKLFKRNAPDCGWYGHSDADFYALQGEINYLRGLKGKSCGAKKRTLTRMSCSYNSAIFMRNDEDSDYSMPCTEAAEVAAAVHGKCKHMSVIFEVEPGSRYLASNGRILLQGRSHTLIEIGYSKC